MFIKCSLNHDEKEIKIIFSFFYYYIIQYKNINQSLEEAHKGYFFMEHWCRKLSFFCTIELMYYELI